MVDQSSYEHYLDAAAQYLEASDLDDQALGAHYQSEKAYYKCPSNDYRQKSQLGARMAEREQEKDHADELLRNSAREKLQAISHLAQETIASYWEKLQPHERRITDTAAAGQPVLFPGYIHSIRILPTAAENVIIGLYTGEGTPPEPEYVSHKTVEREAFPILHRNLSLHHFNQVAQAIYGGQTIRNHKDIGTSKFALQRGLTQIAPHLLPRLLAPIPRENHTNRKAVQTYFKEVIANCRSPMDHGGIELTINPHIDQPYTDEQWQDGVEKSLDAAPRVAQAIVDKCPGTIAVTSYGSLTREGKNYVMFHPRQGLQLGAYFSNDADVEAAVTTAQYLAEEEDTPIKTGTSHGGMFGGSFSGWHNCNWKHIQELKTKLAKPRFSFHLDLDQLVEYTSQLLFSSPLVVTNEAEFDRARRALSKLHRIHLQPSLGHTQHLHHHMESGYPHPLEYHPTQTHLERARNWLINLL
jgi:hypothetical protein